MSTKQGSLPGTVSVGEELLQHGRDGFGGDVVGLTFQRAALCIGEGLRERLTALIRQATIAPKTRRATRPTRAAKERRVASKRRRSQIKQSRRSKPDGEA